jgi:excisionase family DNA binding protein
MSQATFTEKTQESDPILVDVNEAARLLGISVSSIAGMVRREELPSVMIGRRRLFRREALERWAKAQEK